MARVGKRHTEPLKNKRFMARCVGKNCRKTAVVRHEDATKSEQKQQIYGEQNTATLAEIAQANEEEQSFGIHFSKHRPASRRIHTRPLERS